MAAWERAPSQLATSENSDAISWDCTVLRRLAIRSHVQKVLNTRSQWESLRLHPTITISCTVNLPRYSTSSWMPSAMTDEDDNGLTLWSFVRFKFSSFFQSKEHVFLLISQASGSFLFICHSDNFLISICFISEPLDAFYILTYNDMSSSFSVELLPYSLHAGLYAYSQWCLNIVEQTRENDKRKGGRKGESWNRWLLCYSSL